MQTALDATTSSVERSGFGTRFGAYIIDVIIGTGIAFTVGPVLGGLLGAAAANSLTGSTNDAALGGFLGAIAGLVIAMPIVYFVYFLLEAFTGLTIGKLIVGIKVANEDGTQAEVSSLLIRYLIKSSGTIITIAGLFLSIDTLGQIGGLLSTAIFFGCFVVLSSRRQALHDMISKTAVFNKWDIIK